MLASEFINTMVYGFMSGDGHSTREKMEKRYAITHFSIPRIFCKDGFNISVQVSHYCYSASENGVRTFGLDWKLVEWGYPSEVLDDEKYNAEEPDTTDTVGGYVEIAIIDSLCEEHGGVDLQATLQGGVDEEPEKKDTAPAIEAWMIGACL